MNKIIPALDVSNEDALVLIKKLKPVEDLLAGYKVGSLLVYARGINVLKEIKDKTDVPIIYDGQKLGTDIPDIVRDQVELLAIANVDQLIVCPMGGGDETLESFAVACFEYKIRPVCVIEMTHKGAERYLAEDSGAMILRDALDMGIRDFVYPATKPEVLKRHRQMSGLDPAQGEITYKATGFKVQGGLPKTLRDLGVTEFIVGRAIYQADDPVQAVKDLSKEIN
jgi:orotidine-5'-phosphate decarboxylase